MKIRRRRGLTQLGPPPRAVVGDGYNKSKISNRARLAMLREESEIREKHGIKLTPKSYWEIRLSQDVGSDKHKRHIKPSLVELKFTDGEWPPEEDK
jgi:hypothetical protein